MERITNRHWLFIVLATMASIARDLAHGASGHALDPRDQISQLRMAGRTAMNVGNATDGLGQVLMNPVIRRGELLKTWKADQLPPLGQWTNLARWTKYLNHSMMRTISTPLSGQELYAPDHIMKTAPYRNDHHHVN
jgi:hypothetical protein